MHPGDFLLLPSNTMNANTGRPYDLSVDIEIPPALGAEALLALVGRGTSKHAFRSITCATGIWQPAATKELALKNNLRLMPALRPLALKRTPLYRSNQEVAVKHDVAIFRFMQTIMMRCRMIVFELIALCFKAASCWY
jgi:hypothetical protein